MNVINVPSEAPSLPDESVALDPQFDDAIARLCATHAAELSGAVDKLMAAAVAEADAAVKRARATGQTALDEALSDLQEQARQCKDLTESVLLLEAQVEELRLKLQVAGQNAKTAALECEKERTLRARAEAVSEEAQGIREQLVSAYESQLRAVQTELDAERARIAGLKQQLDAERSDRARLLTSLKAVQQACSLADFNCEASLDSRVRTEEWADHQSVLAVQNEPKGVTDRDRESDTAGAGPQVCCDDSSAWSSAEAGPKLKLVIPSQPPAVDTPPASIERVQQLFDQIDAMYWVDCKAHTSLDIVEHLTANLRYAYEVIAREVSSDGGIAAALFNEELFTRLDAHGATSLGRHLAIAAYDLQLQEASDRAQAS